MVVVERLPLRDRKRLFECVVRFLAVSAKYRRSFQLNLPLKAYICMKRHHLVVLIHSSTQASDHLLLLILQRVDVILTLLELSMQFFKHFSLILVIAHLLKLLRMMLR
jgi:hypothetical protein